MLPCPASHNQKDRSQVTRFGDHTLDHHAHPTQAGSVPRMCVAPGGGGGQMRRGHWHGPQEHQQEDRQLRWHAETHATSPETVKGKKHPRNPLAPQQADEAKPHAELLTPRQGVHARTAAPQTHSPSRPAPFPALGGRRGLPVCAAQPQPTTCGQMTPRGDRSSPSRLARLCSVPKASMEQKSPSPSWARRVRLEGHSVASPRPGPGASPSLISLPPT